MPEYAMLSQIGNRTINEDRVRVAEADGASLYILCDGLGGHAGGDVAAETATAYAADLFKARGSYPALLDDIFCGAQEEIKRLQAQRGAEALRTTMTVLLLTPEFARWGNIGDGRLYRFFMNGTRFERTKDHSHVQKMADTGEIEERQIRNHPERFKLYSTLGSVWKPKKNYDLSPILELDGEPEPFLLATDGFWELVSEKEMMQTLRETKSAKAWLTAMRGIVEERGADREMDNYSAICIRDSED